jgi:tetratricopeptide (TPR) repeat protein
MLEPTDVRVRPTRLTSYADPPAPVPSAAGQADAHIQQGIGLAQQGRRPEAIACFRQAVRLCPAHARAHHNLGVALAQEKQYAEAVASFQEALRCQPRYAEAYYNLGNTLCELGRDEEAIAVYHAALLCRPDYLDALNNLGLALTRLARPAEAAVFLRQVVRLRTDFAEGHNNLGLALADQGTFAAAEGCFEQALRLNPRYAEAHTNLGSCFKEQGRLREAVACYELALALEPDSASTHWNRSLAWLQMGNYEQGWPEYEWRWRRKGTPPALFTQPRWDGTPLRDRTVLLHAEQGLGDVLQFLRYAPLVKERGGRVLVAVPPRLVELASTCPGVDRVVPESGPLPPFDTHVPLMSLPALFKTTFNTVPAAIPYLAAEPDRQGRWRKRLAGVPGFKVGIAWQGNPRHLWDGRRSAPLAAFAPLARVPGVSLVSLQKGPGAEQLREAGLPVYDLGEELDPGEEAFLDTAAVMRCLDLVVTVDTAVAHLAGGLAVPVWVALATVADWRWLVGRERTPWYPTMRLFRQQVTGDWHAVFARMAQELGAQATPPPGLPRVPVTPGELLDKLTILGIKGERIADAAKLADVRAEYAALAEVAARAWPHPAELDGLTAELRAVNQALWDVEDALRASERAQDFGPRFVELARSVYRHNDRRAALKGQMNRLLGAPYSEQKSYAEYENS